MMSVEASDDHIPSAEGESREDFLIVTNTPNKSNLGNCERKRHAFVPLCKH